jgi:hypothetical protein
MDFMGLKGVGLFCVSLLGRIAESGIKKCGLGVYATTLGTHSLFVGNI